MKAFTFVSTLLAAVSAAPAPEVVGEIVPTRLNKRFVDPVNPALYRSTEQGVKVLPRFSATSPKDGATRTTISYGSWMVSSNKMLSTTKVGRGPCPSAGCYVTAMEATIVYPDGSEANVDTGSWLHHIALFGTGGGTGSIWASGNERPTLRLNDKQKYGFEFPSMFMMVIDLMRDDTAAKNLTLQLTYEWVPKTAAGYRGTRMYWLTIGEPAAKSGQYKFSTLVPMLSLGSGPLLYTIGHMHDAGTDMRLYIDGKMVCKSIMHYGNPAKGTFTPDGAAAPSAGHGDAHSAMDMSGMDMSGMNMKRQEHSHAMGSGEHIIAPGACTDFGTLSTGSRLSAEAYYDAIAHPLMEMNGKKENLMGNMRVYAGDGGSGSGLRSLFGLKN